MKLSKIIDDKFYDAIDKLSKAQVPAKAAFKLKNIINSLKEEYNNYDKRRKELLIKHSLKNDDGSVKMDGNMPAFNEDGLKAFVEEINELANENISIPVVKLSELGESVSLNVEEANLLEDVIILD